MSTTQVHSPRQPRRRLRTFNKHILNPMMLTLAGRRHWYAAALHHTGRRSGRPYTTPVVAEPVADGFVIPLPYGTQVDWLRNVLAAGHATIDVRGRHHTIVNPQILDAAAAFPLLPTRLQRTWRRFHIEQYLRVRAPLDDSRG
jgi:deazaflavin-dependent oxidoreductase (nitroreductase family)